MAYRSRSVDQESKNAAMGEPLKSPMVCVNDAVKKFGPLVVLDHVSVQINRGEQVVLVGPSGSGKSTLLRCLIGLERLDEGTIEIEGEILGKKLRDGRLVPSSNADFRRVRSKIGMVFQHFNLFPHMTVLQNVMIGLVNGKGMKRDKAEVSARTFLGKVGLLDKIEAHPPQLSGGQKQRVAIARALAMEPDIMLFDEVTSALDVELIGEVLAVMRELAREGMTMIVVTHELHFAEDVADRVLFFHKGKVVEEGPPKSVFYTPQTQEAKRFFRSVLER
jgi:polar amino acid transport system ATP-binding protein